MTLTKEEIKVLWEYLSHQYIHYDNETLLKLVRKLGEAANEK